MYTLISTSKHHSQYSPLWMTETQCVQKELLPLKNLIFQFTEMDPSDENKTGNERIMYQWGTLVQQLLQWKNNKYYIFWMCVCSLMYPACNAHAPCYIVICGCLAVQYFSTLSHKRHDFWGKKCVLIFSTNFVRNISHSKMEWARYYHHKCT